MKFTLEIELGNDAMQTPEDVQEALLQAHDSLSRWPVFAPDAAGRIFDANGNTVGKWQVTQ